MFTFHDLESKFGGPAAYACLSEIEKSVRIFSSEASALDPETRLANAQSVQDAMAALELRSTGAT